MSMEGYKKVFTDEQLVLLKRVIRENEASLYYQLPLRDFEGLLTRLECAEHAMSSLISATGGLETLEVKQWRKSAGKFPFRSKGERG